MSEQMPASYADFKDRLDEIVEAVSDEDISLDDALALYEEAVKVGLKLSDRLESDISEQEAADVVEGGDPESAGFAVADAAQDDLSYASASDVGNAEATGETIEESFVKPVNEALNQESEVSDGNAER